MGWPFSKLVSLNGSCPFSTCSGSMPALYDRYVGSAANARERWNTAVSEFGVVTLLTAAKFFLPGEARAAFRTTSLNVYATSADVNGLPSCQVTPLRSVNVQVSPSFEVFHLVARSGAGTPLRPGFVSPSKSTRLTNMD